MADEILNTDRSIPRWFAVYTRSRHEKTCAEQMSRRSIEHFLATYETVRHWKDRQKRLSLPLFSGYVFVRIRFEERRSVLVIPGVVQIVGFGDRPAPIADQEIENVRGILSRGGLAEPHPYLAVGRRVRIARGVLAGLEGVLIRKKGQLRLLISIELIRQSATIEVDGADVEPVARIAQTIGRQPQSGRVPEAHGRLAPTTLLRQSPPCES
jgi:transcription termination/antitermination protein NusG